MFKLKTFQNYFSIVFIFGLNPYISFDTVDKQFRKLFYCTSVLNLTVTFVVLTAFYRHIFIESKFSIAYLFPIPSIIPNIIIVTGAFRQPHTCHIISRMFCRLINYLENNLNVKFSIEQFEKVFRKKFLYHFTVLITTFIFKLIFTVKTTYNLKLTTDILIFVIFTFELVQNILIVFYIDFVNFLIKSLIERLTVVERDLDLMPKSIKCMETIRILLRVKRFHFKLIHCVERINSRFGWFMVFSMLGKLSEFTFSALWVFLFSATPPGITGLLFMRKYSIFINSFDSGWRQEARGFEHGFHYRIITWKKRLEYSQSFSIHVMDDLSSRLFETNL